ncbi:SseB family protein [Streptomyces albidus (ex Kaewkla and Franco 2022)]|uniref:SseB family protein n=1 Tax=Streptomyces albidus (ex Kaewkla and Franco 2022) TaxID=722709 RepID=UPI002814FFC2|nr:SseB family protein [Streptomyces albidus (ex Kaewkla and Franco 2022)]
MRLADLVAAEQQTREDVAAARKEFLDFLDEFRHTPVLVPLDDQGALWSAEFSDIRWILAFSDEKALSRFAGSRGDLDVRQPATVTDEGTQGWNYRRVMGRRLLCSVIPAVGRPCGVALDAGSEAGRVLPPVTGIVPDSATVDAYAAGVRRR